MIVKKLNNYTPVIVTCVCRRIKNDREHRCACLGVCHFRAIKSIHTLPVNIFDTSHHFARSCHLNFIDCTLLAWWHLAPPTPRNNSLNQPWTSFVLKKIRQISFQETWSPVLIPSVWWIFRRFWREKSNIINARPHVMLSQHFIMILFN